MDAIKAKILSDRIIGKKIDQWEIKRYINHGKSAAVFFAEASDGTAAAVKIFDDELIERYGGDVQLARIDRELSLIGKHHPNMVGILAGGVDALTKNHYIVMEYLDGKNLKQCLSLIPVDRIWKLISQLASCAEFLESHQLCHRDIKPENILILDDCNRLVLLDFGVIRPIGKPGLTDDDGIQSFIGTLQYSSPEFLLRKEEDTVEGWRALTFYQIGAVLHDLIMRKEIFQEYANPYARLVNAVQQVQPNIQNSAIDPILIELARSCLLKTPEHRLRLVTWKSFHPTKGGEGNSAKQRVTNRAMLALAEGSQSTPANKPDSAGLINDTIEFLKTSILQIRQDNGMFPPLAIATRVKKQNKFKARINPSTTHSLSEDLTIIVAIEIVDVAAKAIALSITAFLGKEPNEAEPNGKVFFQGLYDSALIHSSFEECVYATIEAAQQKCLTNGAGWL